MLYICIPAYNEASTVGVLLWRIRKVFQGFSREYEIIVYDDGSTDGTGEVLAPYAEVIPLTVIRGEKTKGFGHALDVLCREVSKRTRYARRDGMLTMQADFTDQPEHIPELVKRFEGGADVIVADRLASKSPKPVKRLGRLARGIFGFFSRVEHVNDPFSSLALIRISVLRELLKPIGDQPVITSDGWAARAELIRKTVPLARRIENVVLDPRYDIRTRPSRVRILSELAGIFRLSRSREPAKAGPA